MSTALLYADQTLLHSSPWSAEHAENPERLSAIIDKLTECNLLQRCSLLPFEPATEELLSLAHSQDYIRQIEQTESMSDDERKQYCQTLASVYLNKHSNLAARSAVGCVVRAVDAVHRNEVRNAFCAVRPPGRHAMQSEASGSCLFNNLAIGALYALEKLNLNRVVIIDLSRHHGHGTQYAFYHESRVLTISIHCHNADDARCWPNLRESDYDFIGIGRGRGYNINVALDGSTVTDSDYLAVFNQLILPILYDFDPDLILLATGFDLAVTDQSHVNDSSPSLVSHLVHKLSCLAEAKLVTVLEGGCGHLDFVAESAAHLVSTLLGDHLPGSIISKEPSQNALQAIQKCVSVLRFRWKCLNLFQLNSSAPATDSGRQEYQNWTVCKRATLDPLDKKFDAKWLPEMIERSGFKKSDIAVRNRSNDDQFSKVCLVYDSRMENHKNEGDPTHPECPNRIRQAFELLEECDLVRRCCRVEARHATRDELIRVHRADYVDLINSTSKMKQQARDDLADSYDSVYLNRHSYDCACLAAGSVLAIVDHVCTGKSLYGLALVRPPGHHASHDRAMGFCLFNNVAIGVRHAQQTHSIKRIAVVDWDVHHGNGTKEIFDDDPDVLFISLHRYDEGSFFPSTDSGSPADCGSGKGLGRTLHLGWNGRHAKDSEYITAWLHLVIPVLTEFRPEMVFVSAGFDAARGDRLGGLSVSPDCFAHLTHHLIGTVCSSASHPKTPKLVLVLEGGYNIGSTALAACHCVASLLGECPPRLATGLTPNEKACKAIRRSLICQEPHWNFIQSYGPVDSCIGPSPSQRRPTRSSALTDPPIPSPSPHVQFNLINSDPSDADFSLNTDTQQLNLRLIDSTEWGPATIGTTTTTPESGRHQQLIDLSADQTVLNVTNPLSMTASSSASVDQLTEALGRLTTANPSTVIDDHVSQQEEEDELSSRLSSLRPINLQTVNDDVVFNTNQVTSTTLTTLVPSVVRITSPSTNTPSTVSPGSNQHHQQQATATLRDLIASNDIHSFLGLHSSQRLPSQLYAVTPLSWCPHLDSVCTRVDWDPDVRTNCSRCEHNDENWACLTCYVICCGRFANSHMLEHFSSHRHPIVLSFADLSTWCYECEAYVHNDTLTTAKRTAHRAKFGVDLG